MNRELKLRAWDAKQKHMAYQGTPDLETMQSFMHHYGGKQLMQFTGLKDKNGREIYEGDILTDKVMVDGEVINSAIPVLYSNEMAMFVVDVSFTKNGSYIEPLYQYCEGMEVFGNIYQNKKQL